MDIEVREPRSEQEFALYRDLRWRILREPWTTVRESGLDEFEDRATHLTAWVEGKLVGTGRLHLNSPEEAQVRCMAVEEGWARKGVGTAVLKALESKALHCGAKRIVLSARDSALPFYTSHRYTRLGRSNTLFESIGHWWMRKDLV